MDRWNLLLLLVRLPSWSTKAILDEVLQDHPRYLMRKDWAVQGTEGVVKPLLTTRPAIGGLFSNPNPDVQSLW
ncbi:unnamed protein product [Linum tenue]|uniref:Uncharacterized protein n=1 Tax=Linum tenue TaxID=586396 RepID=A0AAV0KSH2_9ROSI|nr:unnamed protein product [Linum tenue]